MLKILVWGTGFRAAKFAEYYAEPMKCFAEIVCFIDNNPLKQKCDFFGYEVVSYNDSKDYEYDYIVIMNLFEGEIRKQVRAQGDDDSKIIPMWEFFSMYVRQFPKRDKTILYIGERLTYEIVRHQSKYMFKKVMYISNVEEFDPKCNVDAIILCPPRLMNKEDTARYEDSIISVISQYIDTNKVYRWDACSYYYECDHQIIGGTLNPDKAFLIIPQGSPYWGWGNMLCGFVQAIAYARRHDLIPVVDMKYMRSQYQREDLLGKHNAFEDYFHSLNQYELDEVYQSKNVWLHGVYPSYDELDKKISELRYNLHTRNYIEEQFNSLFPKQGKVLGVIYRGTDYHIAYNHPKPKSIAEFIKYAEVYKEETKCEYIFLATEVEEATNLFKEYFGDKVFYIAQPRYSENERRILYSIKSMRENDEHLKGLEHLAVLELLSKCHSLLGMDTGFFRAAIVMNNGKYENMKML